MRLGFFTFGVLLAGLFFLSGCDNVTENYRLEGDKRLKGDQHLVVVRLDLEKGSVVEGDLNVTASKVNINGRIKGDLTVFASEIKLESDAHIEGDLIYCLVDQRKFERKSGAVIDGTVRGSCTDARKLEIETTGLSRWVLRLIGNLILSVSIGLLTAFGTVVLYKPMERIHATAHQHRWTALGLGLLTLLVAVGLSSLWRISLAIIVPLVFAPLIVIGWVMLVGFSLLGSASLAYPFGVWLLKRLHRQPQVPMVSGMIGGTVLTFLILIFRLVPPLTPVTNLLSVVFIAWGLGAVLLTRAGTCDYVEARKVAAATKV